MTSTVLRNIVVIDEEKCDGCGLCIPSCAEGALEIVEGKAKLISDIYCDGLGACLGQCPSDAIRVLKREAQPFDEESTKLHLQQSKENDNLPCGCPSTTVTQFARTQSANEEVGDRTYQSMLSHWPVQLTLVPPTAPFLQGADILFAADCVPFSFAGFHQRLLKDRALLVACPKLDDFQAHLDKLTEIIRASKPHSITVARMEVPCCFGLTQMAREAIRLSEQNIALNEIVIGTRGDILSA